MKQLKLSTLFVVLLLAFSACKKVEILSQAHGTLLESKEIKTISKAECVQLVDSADISQIATYDVKLIQINYVTEYQGKNIETSGMLFVPVGKDTVNFVNYNHGTVVPLKLLGMDEGTPSLFAGQSSGFGEIKNIGLTWASAGYTVFMPDYIGYGKTRKLEHPFVYYPELFKSIYDGDLAVKSYLHQQSAYFDDKIFLTGWSLGSGASLSAQRYLENEHPSDFHIIASLNLSGPYSFKHFIQSIYDKKDTYNSKLNIYSWAIYAVNKFSELKRPNDQYFSYPVFDQASAFNPPQKVPSKIFNMHFIKAIIDGTDVKMNNVLTRNSMISGWVPQAKIYLYHGDADNFVPYFNSEDCYNGLSAVGADIHLTTYQGKNHYTVFPKYLIDAKNQMDQLK